MENLQCFTLCAPSFVRPVVCAPLLVSVFTLLPRPATAQAGSQYGYYSGPVYSGGTYTNPHPPNPPVDDGPRGDNNTQWGGNTGTAYGYDASSNYTFSGSSSCDGDLTATFTWVPANNSTAPPPPVIVTETTNSGWSADEASGTGGFSNPYNCPTTPSSTGYGVSETGTHYSKEDGASSVPITVSLTASGGGTGSSSAPGVHSVSDFAVYGASVSPVTISLGGTLTDSNGNPVLDSSGNQQVLTGQQITAGVVGIPISSGWSVTKYTWTAGGSTFKDYDFTQPSNQLVALGSDDLTGPASGSTSVSPLAFYDRAQENLTVTCAVTVQAPDGTSLSLTATSPTVDVKKPSVTRWGIAEGYVQPGVNDSGQTTYGLYQDPATSNPQGMTWHDVAVTVPTPFSGGRCDFAQLTEPDREEYHGNTSNPINNDPKNGLLGLDGAFPYSYGGYGSGWNPPASGGNSDGPRLAPNGNSNNDTQQSANDTFTTWVIYRPPSQNGNGTVWVPLQKYSWTWSAQLTWSSSQWNITAAFPATAGAGPHYTPQNTNDPPQWSLIH